MQCSKYKSHRFLRCIYIYIYLYNEYWSNGKRHLHRVWFRFLEHTYIEILSAQFMNFPVIVISHALKSLNVNVSLSESIHPYPRLEYWKATTACRYNRAPIPLKPLSAILINSSRGFQSLPLVSPAGLSDSCKSDRCSLYK